MATTVIYNGVKLYNVSTKLWQETVYYDQSNTDPIGVRYSLQFDALVHIQGLGEGSQFTAPSYTSDNRQHADATTALRAMVTQLQQPRKRLQVLFGDQAAINIVPHSGPDTYPQIEDIENGPKPQNVQLFHIAGDQCYRIRFGITASTNNCLDRGRVSLAVNNRWTVQEAMDENFAIQRTITGSVRLTGSPRADNSIDPLAARDLAFPTLEDGFRRQSVSYTSSIDGLSLNYQIVDRQSRYAAPWPATRISGTHSEQTMDGYRFVSSATCRLTGPPHCAVPDLIARAIQFTQFRINWNRRLNVDSENTTRILDAYVREDIGDVPTVEAGVRVEQIYTDQASILAKVKNNKWGQLELPALGAAGTPQEEGANTASYRVNWHHAPSVYGYNEWLGARNPTSSSFLRCVLQGQCGSPAELPSGQRREVKQYDSEPIRESSETQINEQSSSSELDNPDAASTWTDEHLDAMYLAVKHNNKYLWRQPLAQLPVAGNVSPGRSSASVVKLSAPTSARVVEIDYERLGKPPEVPPWDSHKIGAANLTPASLVLEPLPPRLAADGENHVYRVTATYTYLADRELSRTGGVPIGRLPVNSRDVTPSELRLGDVINPSLDP